jgi:cysteine-rich repeat protein
MQQRNARGFGRIVRGAGRLGLVASAVLLVASGCSDEVGGDGFVPEPSAGKGGIGGGAGTLGDGGLPADGGASGEPTVSGGKAGTSNQAGTSGKGGRGGSSTMTDGGMGGESTGTVVCGNNATEAGEECDDGNTKSGDGCTADCKSACEVCEKAYCKAVRAQEAGEHNWVQDGSKIPYDLVATCFEMPGLAEAGPAQGVPRKDLCLAVVDCIRQEKCSQLVPDDLGATGNIYTKASEYAFLRCFCDLDVTHPSYITQCSNPATFVAGKCQRAFQEASERDDVTQAFNGINTLGKPLGVANSLLQACDKKLCTEECLPQFTVGAVAQISSDILAARNASRESPLGDLIADAQRSAMAADIGIVSERTYVSDFSSRGLIFKAAPGRGADADGRLLESEVRHALFGMSPQGATTNREGGSKLVKVDLTGQQIYDYLQADLSSSESLYLQVSGLTYTWDGTTNKIIEMRKGATAIDKGASYSVAVNDNLLQNLPAGTNLVAHDKSPEVELVEYLKAQPQPIAPPKLERIVRVN